MPSHEDKYISLLLSGFGSLTAAVMIMVYACFERIRYDDWYYWGLAASALFCLGSYLMLHAFVHKVKSDLSRRNKLRDQFKASRDNETLD